jgi:hypothetical protein
MKKDRIQKTEFRIQNGGIEASELRILTSDFWILDSRAGGSHGR